MMIMRNIEHLGERYCKRYLDDTWKKESLENDWWDALKFFFSHSFMRGRRDKLSNEYYIFTIKTLEDYFSITTKNLDVSYENLKKQKKHFDKECILKFRKDKKIRNSIKDQDFEKEIAEKNPIVKVLFTQREVKVKWEDITRDKNIHLGNDEDIMMVLDVLKFIADGRKNIYNSLLDIIINSGVEKAHNELIVVRAIGNKIAPFIIRDIVLMNSKIKIADEDYKFAFPVDTWVIKIANKLGCSSTSIEEIKNYLINKCKESGVEPLKFAAGLWYLGFHSLDILLEDCLGRIEIGSIASVNSR